MLAALRRGLVRLMRRERQRGVYGLVSDKPSSYTLTDRPDLADARRRRYLDSLERGAVDALLPGENHRSPNGHSTARAEPAPRQSEPAGQAGREVSGP